MSSGETGKRKRASGDSPSFTIPSKKQKSSKGMSITIPGLKRKAPATPGAGPSTSRDADATGGSNLARIRQNGTQMWMAVRAARSKDGLEVAHDFLKLPPKRLYPDYYKFIQQPISLDDIKGRLDGEIYQSLKAVKDDLDLCFNNAFQYNMEHSPIWEAAKIMQRLAHQEYKLLSQQDDTDGEIDVGEAAANAATPRSGDLEEDDDDDGDDNDNDEEYDATKKKQKSPYTELSNVLNTRLQKLITKAPKDPGGGLISDPFLVLPNKKEWPQYFQLIKKPIAFDMIEKKLKKRAYHSSSEFAADVEQLFDNAMLFNEDNSPIWIAAQTLRASFHKLMADLPSQYAWAKPQPTKIKLKVQQPKSQPGPPPAAVAAPAPPPTPTPAPKKAVTPAPTVATLSTKPTFRAQPAPPARKPPPVPQTASATPPAAVASSVAARPSPATVTAPAHQPPRPTYQQQSSQLHHSQTQTRTTVPNPTSNIVYQPQPLMPSTPGHLTPPVALRSPSPEVVPSTTIKQMGIIATPSKRQIHLMGTPFGEDATTVSVRCFAVRLGWNETSIRLNVEAERAADDENTTADDEQTTAPIEGDASAPSVTVDGRKVLAEVRCNGSHISPATKAPILPQAKHKSSPPMETNGDAKLNGHAVADGPASDSEHGGDEGSDDSSSNKPRVKEEGMAVRATRSGRVPSVSMKNGKLKRRKKKGAASRVLMDLGQWDVSLVLGSNVVDVKIGGQEGESWRIFVDRSL